MTGAVLLQSGRGRRHVQATEAVIPPLSITITTWKSKVKPVLSDVRMPELHTHNPLQSYKDLIFLTLESYVPGNCHPHPLPYLPDPDMPYPYRQNTSTPIPLRYGARRSSTLCHAAVLGDLTWAMLEKRGERPPTLPWPINILPLLLLFNHLLRTLSDTVPH